MPTRKTCFFVAPIGPPESDIRKRSDQLKDFVLKPVLSKMGYNVLRADELPNPGLITSQIIEHLTQDELVVADLSFQNPNVYYELAIRHATAKAFIQIKDPTVTLPFDVTGLRTIDVDYRFVTSMDHCKDELVRHVESIEGGAKIVTPLSFTLDLLSLRKGRKKESQALVELASQVQALKKDVERLKAPSTSTTTFQASGSLSPYLLPPATVAFSLEDALKQFPGWIPKPLQERKKEETTTEKKE